MFTGIVECIGKIESITQNGTNYTFWVNSPLSSQFKIDQSVSHNGVCLTVEEVIDHQHRVTAIEETIKKTNLQYWSVGSYINIEQCMQMNGKLDGHIVQGHVDTTAICVEALTLAGSWEYRFEFAPEFAHLVIEKGSISVNGTSLTCFDVTKNSFKVAIIPYTYHHTSIHQVVVGSIVNIEFDIIGKYVSRMAELKN
ncbi:riboflavin synthase [Parasediminibacterium paludis]|uniref:Riboflavin synthase n=1 Tax=Parasediminibacterium paludis TaxID=908966 RepID=A0ABV8PXJ9_9BACT